MCAVLIFSIQDHIPNLRAQTGPIEDYNDESSDDQGGIQDQNNNDTESINNNSTNDVASPGDTIPPLSPTGFRATSNEEFIKLEWDQGPDDDILGYRIYPRTYGEEEQQANDDSKNKDTNPTDTKKDQPSQSDDQETEQQQPGSLRKADQKKKGSYQDLKKITIGNQLEYKFEFGDPDHVYFFSIAAVDTSGNESQRTYEIASAPIKKDESIGPKRVSAWMPTNWDRDDAIAAFRDNADLFDTISFFWFNLEPDGKISAKGGARDRGLINLAHINHINVVPTITNNYSPEKTSKVLNDKEILETHISTIVDEVINTDYEGIDIDYEAVDPKDKNQFTLFLQELAKRLHAKNKMLIVTLQPKESDNAFWNGPGAMDYDQIGKIADRVRIMTYDKHRKNTKPGPIAPIDWMTRVLAFTRTKIPAEKIEAGVPFYGYDWCDKGEGENAGLVWDGVQNILEKYKDQNIEIKWNEEAHEPYFNYNDGKCEDVVYFQNSRSISSKIDVMIEQGLGGISIWRLGSEDPGYFEMIREKLDKQPEMPIHVHARPGNGKIYLSWDPGEQKNVAGYKIYYGFVPESYPEVEVIGPQTEYVIDGLVNDVPVFFTLNAYDTFKNSGKRPASYSATPTNNVPPARINDLKVVNTFEYSTDLSWTAPGDDGDEGKVFEYDIRYSTHGFDQQTWDEAEKYKFGPRALPAGERQSFQIRDLESGVLYYFAIKAIDKNDNASALSNVVSTKTIDVVPPATPANVTFENRNASVFLSWDANTENDLAGYRVYYRADGEKEFTQLFAGNEPPYLLSFLTNEKPYTIALTSIDFIGNESEKSSQITARPRYYDATDIPYFSQLDAYLMNTRLGFISAHLAGNVITNETHLVFALIGALIFSAISLALVTVFKAREENKDTRL